MRELEDSRWARPTARSTFPPRYQQQKALSTSPARQLAPPINAVNALSSHQSTKPVKSLKSERDLLSRRDNYVKYQRLHRRLRWKTTTLLFCHHRAVHRETNNIINGLNFPLIPPHSGPQALTNDSAVLMFKTDFFEFYTLLERVLVHLLGSVGLLISADYGAGPDPSVHIIPDPHDPSMKSSIFDPEISFGDSRVFHNSSGRHRYHANVLAALDQPSNPLHPILGSGIVRTYLGIAKEFRNRWKDKDLLSLSASEKMGDDHEEADDDISDLLRRYERIMTELKLDEMLSCILTALDDAGSVVEDDLSLFEKKVETLVGYAVNVRAGEKADAVTTARKDSNAIGHGHPDRNQSQMQVTEENFEAIDDAMELD